MSLPALYLSKEQSQEAYAAVCAILNQTAPTSYQTCPLAYQIRPIYFIKDAEYVSNEIHIISEEPYVAACAISIKRGLCRSLHYLLSNMPYILSNKPYILSNMPYILSKMAYIYQTSAMAVPALYPIKSPQLQQYSIKRAQTCLEMKAL